jgi:hypothetical protein
VRFEASFDRSADLREPRFLSFGGRARVEGGGGSDVTWLEGQLNPTLIYRSVLRFR